MLNLDTHILIHALQGKLTPGEDQLLRNRRWGISAIVIWEIAKLAELNRIEMDLESDELQSAYENLQIWPIDLPLCRRIKDLDFDADPADELIAATSLHHNVPLVTRDRRIRASKIVPLA